MGFFQTYQDLLVEKFPVFPPIIFRKDLNHKFRNVETIKLLKNITKQQITREQILLKDSANYYVAKDPSTSTIYMCFKELMMIDIDGENDCNNALIKLKKFCKKNKHHLFYVYGSRNGIHIFCMSHKKDYNNLDHIKFMIDMKSDFFYALYAHIRGWSVRLNKKFGEDNSSNDSIIRSEGLTNSVSTFLCSIGTGKPHKSLETLIQKYEFYLKKHKDSPPCKQTVN